MAYFATKWSLPIPTTVTSISDLHTPPVRIRTQNQQSNQMTRKCASYMQQCCFQETNTTTTQKKHYYFKILKKIKVHINLQTSERLSEQETSTQNDYYVKLKLKTDLFRHKTQTKYGKHSGSSCLNISHLQIIYNTCNTMSVSQLQQ